MNDLKSVRSKMLINVEYRWIIAMFLLGFSSLFSVNFIGTLTLQEIFIGVVGPWVIAWRDINRNPILRIFCMGVVSWFLIQVATDFYREIPIENLLKGSARIIFFALAFFLFWEFMRTHIQKAGAFLLGTAVASIGSLYLFPTELSFSDPWKWHYGPAVTYGIFGTLCIFKPRVSWLWAIALISLGVVNALFNYRSLAGVNIAVGLFIISNFLFLRLSLWLRAVSALGGAVLVLFIYSTTASSGLLGEPARLKYEAQRREGGSFLTILSGGRSEYRASLRAVADSPIIGYGSWAERPEYIIYALDPEKDNPDSYSFKLALERGYIPSHSILVGSWVDAGILPGLLWLYLWLMVAYYLLRNRINLSDYGPLAATLAVGLLWSIIFSPFGSSNRTMVAFSLVVVIIHHQISLRNLNNYKMANSRQCNS
jgi:O-antigen ligase